MTWTYVGPSEDNVKDIIRFKVGDTDPDMPLLLDEEITYLIGSHTSRYRMIVDAVRAIIAKLAQQVNYKIGPESVDASDRLRHYQLLLVDMKATESSNVEYVLSQPITHSPLFDIGMNDNPQQEPFLNGCLY